MYLKKFFIFKKFINKSNILSLIFLFTSATLLFIFFLKYSNANANDYIRLKYLPYVLFFGVTIIFSFLSFLLRISTKINILIFSISILIALYIIEGYIILSFKNKYSNFELNNKIKYDVRSKIEFYEDLKKKNSNVVLNVPIISSNNLYSNYNKDDLVPLSGVSNKLTITCNENGYFATYKSDRHGFNNPDKAWDENNIKFLLIGDSFVQGNCVNADYTIGAKLRKYSKKNVLNLGYNSTGPLEQYATLREYLSKVKPKIIIWFYFEGNDIQNLEQALSVETLKKYLINKRFTQNLVGKQNKIDNLLNKKLRTTYEIEKKRKNKIKWMFNEKLTRTEIYISYLKLSAVRKMTIDAFTYQLAIQKKGVPKEFKEIMILSKNLARENNTRFYFVYLPEKKRIQKNNSHKNLKKYFLKNKIMNTVSALNIDTIDISKIIISKKIEIDSIYPFTNYGHFNEKGYDLIAKLVLDSIKKFENKK